MFKATKIREDIYWVGALEWEERYIHGISMPYGSTNNAYLILDEQVTLIDTCISSHAREVIERIADVIDPAKIDIIVSNHSEKDHAGSIGAILEAAPHAKVVTSVKGEPILRTYYGERDYLPMKTGDTLSIGKRTLHFIQTPMVHWPDNMVTWSPFDKTLFSNDAFGQFIATSKRFDDEVDLPVVLACAKKYFANILAPYTKQTAKAVEAVEGLDLDTIAPAHGIIWREHISDIMSLYKELCACRPKDAAVVVYSSMYGSTERMATTITEAFMAQGVAVRQYDLDISDISDIITDVFFAKYVALGSPTHNMTVLPPMGEFLTYFKGLAPKTKDRIGISFGAYGWMDAAQKEIAAVFEKAGYALPMASFAEDWNDTAAGERELFDAVTSLVEEARR